MVRYDKEETSFVHSATDTCTSIVHETMGFCHGFEKHYYVFYRSENKKSGCKFTLIFTCYMI